MSSNKAEVWKQHKQDRVREPLNYPDSEQPRGYNNIISRAVINMAVLFFLALNEIQMIISMFQ
ncbi:hypothetical protein [Oceanobacillus picturae]|uniref:hypothetical protein n=1 Tax=Oceanobacillus picturae TaxID=171693 RepID=UPI00363FBD48